MSWADGEVVLGRGNLIDLYKILTVGHTMSPVSGIAVASQAGTGAWEIMRATQPIGKNLP